MPNVEIVTIKDCHEAEVFVKLITWANHATLVVPHKLRSVNLDDEGVNKLVDALRFWQMRKATISVEEELQ